MYRLVKQQAQRGGMAYDPCNDLMKVMEDLVEQGILKEYFYNEISRGLLKIYETHKRNEQDAKDCKIKMEFYRQKIRELEGTTCIQFVFKGMDAISKFKEHFNFMFNIKYLLDLPRIWENMSSVYTMIKRWEENEFWDRSDISETASFIEKKWPDSIRGVQYSGSFYFSCPSETANSSLRDLYLFTYKKTPEGSIFGLKRNGITIFDLKLSSRGVFKSMTESNLCTSLWFSHLPSSIKDRAEYLTSIDFDKNEIPLRVQSEWASNRLLLRFEFKSSREQFHEFMNCTRSNDSVVCWFSDGSWEMHKFSRQNWEQRGREASVSFPNVRIKFDNSQVPSATAEAKDQCEENVRECAAVRRSDRVRNKRRLGER